MNTCNSIIACQFFKLDICIFAIQYLIDSKIIKSIPETISLLQQNKTSI